LKFKETKSPKTNHVDDLSSLMAELRTKPTCTIGDAARALSIGLSTAYAAARAGQIPAIRLGNRFVVPTASLLRMLGLDVPAALDAP
jgi:excisionase family DNA binding protein